MVKNSIRFYRAQEAAGISRYGMRKTATCGFLSDGASAISARKSRGKCATSRRGKTAGESEGRAGLGGGGARG